jgi:hypothetical protein
VIHAEDRLKNKVVIAFLVHHRSKIPGAEVAGNSPSSISIGSGAPPCQRTKNAVVLGFHVGEEFGCQFR